MVSRAKLLVDTNRQGETSSVGPWPVRSSSPDVPRKERALTESDFDLDFRPRFLVPWLTRPQQRFHVETTRGIENGDVLICSLPETLGAQPSRSRPAGPYFLATFAAEPGATALPVRGFLLARPVRGRRFEIEDSRNTRRGVESFGSTVVPRIPSLREVIAMIDGALNRGWEEFGPALSTWQETLRQRYLRYPGDWSFWVRSLNYPQLEAWYQRQWERLDLETHVERRSRTGP